jgi:hypothetical protein
VEYVTVPLVPSQPTGSPDDHTFVPVPVPDPDFAVEAEPVADRTPNGLRKRIPSARKAAPVAAMAPSARPAGRPIDDSPDKVRARLTALRDGLRRGSGPPARP